MQKWILAALLGTGLAQAQRFGDVTVETSPSFSENIQGKAVVLQSREGDLGMYIFCIDSRTPNVSVYLNNSDFTEYGYHNGARVPVTWQADAKAKVKEQWQVIGQNDDLRRYGQLGLITAQLYNTKQNFKVTIVDKTFNFPARGVGQAMKQLPCVVRFLKSTGYLK